MTSPYPPGPPPQLGYPTNVPGPPPPHRSYTKLIVIGIAAVVVVLVVVGIGGATLYANRDKVFGGKAPGPFQSASSGKPIYRKLPGCDAMPTAALARLVPAMDNTLNVRREPENASDGPYGVCQWDNLESDNKPPNEDRSVKVTLQGYADNVTPGIAAAKQNLADARDTADDLTGKTDGDHKYGRVRELADLGPGAFAQDYTVNSPTWLYGGTDVYLQADNLVVTLEVIGADGPDSKEKPMAAAQADAGASGVAKDVMGWLSSCADCES
ncbi:hypothetical protein [Rugosimonospora africana]|uniref:DUF3558 domain-containing protein n=1 Tax=Rugosimonospora africana TaxID=556532 RepID=A0A8J3VW48_9ACTN|nr:hypothetical protein [Rugosimonospora africana]GIH20589.1 hypothetical protein Raf01_87610 [Rugosimonospora africana]